MGQNSKIEWTDHTWNPWVGCFKVSPGCAHCYAERDMTRKGRWANTWGPPTTTERIRTKTWGQLDKFARIARETGVRQKVFVMSLGDFFEDNPQVEPWRDEALELMPEYSDTLDFLVLTKRPENVDYMLPSPWGNVDWPRNVHLGFSAEDQERFDERWEHAREWGEWGNPVTWVSAEPLLGHISFPANFLWHPSPAWVIVGGESGPGARPMDRSWSRSLRDQCSFASSLPEECPPTPFFFKQWGEWDEQDNKVGKKKAGSLLDGLEYKQFPSALGGMVEPEQETVT